MARFWIVVGLVLLSSLSVLYAEEPDEKILITRASRELDLTSQVVKQGVSLTILNEGDLPANSFLYTVDNVMSDKLAYIEAKGKTKESLSLEKTTVGSHPGVMTYRIDFASPLTPKETTNVVVNTVFSRVIAAFPKEITQFEKQFVQFVGNAYVFLPYRSKTQNTEIKLSSSNIESYTRVSPVTSDGAKISYGPYTDLAPFSNARMTLHYENNNPFLTIKSFERVIQVSHWGVIQVEEHIRVHHSGALLKGSFSRFDYQRNPNSGHSAVKSYTTLLPAAAQDVYYRDEIGNISTSHLRNSEDYTELIIRPRFPLFGGWQTYYYIGYNVPTYEYLYHQASHFVLDMRFVDHVYDDQVIDEATVKIILPEGSKNINFLPPYPVHDQATSVHSTYLDTVGRPVIIAKAYNLVEQHILNFQLEYDFESYLLLQEPFLLIGALFLFFLFIIFLVRLDFSITKDPEVVARQQAAVLKENIVNFVDSRFRLVDQFLGAVESFKKSKNHRAFNSTCSDTLERFAAYGKNIEAQQDQLRKIDNEASTKVTTIVKKMTEISDILSQLRSQADAAVSGRTSQQAYAKEEDASKKKLKQSRSEVESLVQTL
ncbi:PREDICTED: dolichyl-diphosphooligosaccharide--protein glycosyltransferase subunit 1-like [Amphimedon queenslandica]|uniref:Dolichyl-diphosphooligosaccharide--protein glycosyltransferase subunit 1 n=1 Tax=Amphimedon queenslandica TaxID=400682 RepID=A0A1X7VTG5_AMPQE|nr:PREDICTED: dolichyl-diphosphooligosaccharide--protein glycosyltransferase subunit 1-like [Amphimedon queenslandica]|eukprot:XP_003382687.1 PREDICTED: dolichyl-diphosphooligosaccharide--protein glycosyltransferase subunit 1-like [Amphimedon queenslandica]